MRAPTLVILCAAAPLLFGQAPDGPNRFGQTIKKILSMGHDKWVDWYVAEPRRGSRVDAENSFCMALHERNVAILQRRPKEEQDFLSECRSMFADLAKTAFVAGSEIEPQWQGWPVAIAESSTAVNLALYEVMTGKGTGPKVSEETILAVWALGENRMLALPTDNVGRNSYMSMKHGMSRVFEKFSSKKKNARDAALRFCLAMTKLASTERT